MQETNKKPGRTPGRRRLLATSVLAGVTAITLPALVGVAVFGAAPAAAQDYTNGTLAGTVTDSGGAPVAGASVQVKSLDQGVVREATTNAEGQFRLPLIPLGGYSVTVSADGYSPLTDQNVRVRLGGSSAYTFTVRGADEVEEVVVTAARAELDFAGTTTGLTMDLAELADQVPIPRDITSVTLMAPGAIRGSNAGQSNGALIAQQPAIGGASGAENAFYVNGLNVTNFNTYLGGSLIPFDFYKTVETKTGGYPAEFGRATGGVINAVTKSGTNDFEMGVSGVWEPAKLQAASPNTFLDRNDRNDSNVKTLTVEAGGPILKDRLFFYGLAQFRDNETKDTFVDSGTHRVSRSNDPFYGLKLDGYITDDHRVEVTYFDTNRTTNREFFGYDDANDKILGLDSTGTVVSGGESYVARYTGSFTDWLTVSAAYGENKEVSNVNPADTSTPYILDNRDLNNPVRLGSQVALSLNLTDTDRKFYRGDVDVYFDLMGSHHVRAGFDNEELLLNRAVTSTGGRGLTYYTAAAGNAYGIAAGQSYVEVNYYRNGGGFSANNNAIYVQDSWDVTDTLNVQLGVRKDTFENFNGAGENFVTFDNEIGLRGGFTWDPRGEGNDKVFGSFGRYYLPVAANSAYRQTGGELNATEVFLINQDPAASPNGIVPFGTQVTGWAGVQECPVGTPSAGQMACNVTADGTPVATDTSVAHNLQSTYEDEFILGYERRLNDLWKVGATLQYRTLGRTAEDAALDRAIQAYCVREGIPLNRYGSGATRGGCGRFSGFAQYAIINPGQDTTVTLRFPVNGEAERRTVTLRAEDMGYPKPERVYTALALTVERAFDGKWGLQGSYVLSKTEGNFEGSVKSDVGQIDSGITQDFDQPSLIDGATGLLPNHRAHVFKAFGTYAINDDLTLGVNGSVISPKKQGCIGNHPTDPILNVNYGPAAWYCNGKLTPRASQMESDWTTNLDLMINYRVPNLMGMPGALDLSAQIFNVFDAQAVTSRWEIGEVQGGAADPNYGRPVSYQTPRYVRLGFDWKW